MSAEMAAKAAQASPGSTPVLTAPLHCPYFPRSIAATTTSVHALAASSVNLPVLLAKSYSSEAGRAAARMSQIRTHAGRGPPPSLLG